MTNQGAVDHAPGLTVDPPTSTTIQGKGIALCLMKCTTPISTLLNGAKNSLIRHFGCQMGAI